MRQTGFPSTSSACHALRAGAGALATTGGGRGGDAQGTTSDLWDTGAAEKPNFRQWRNKKQRRKSEEKVREEKRREEKRREEKSKSETVRRKKMQVREKVGKWQK